MDMRNSSLDLSPAKWIWYPSGRTLQNTFVLFRKDIVLKEKPQNVKGWILADSRYRLFINGVRVQWGPAPSDPRWQEADPLDLTTYFQKGENTIAVEVCFFGTGDGTHPMGKPGFILNLDVDQQKIITDKQIAPACSKALTVSPLLKIVKEPGKRRCQHHRLKRRKRQNPRQLYDTLFPAPKSAYHLHITEQQEGGQTLKHKKGKHEHLVPEHRNDCRICQSDT